VQKRDVPRLTFHSEITTRPGWCRRTTFVLYGNEDPKKADAIMRPLTLLPVDRYVLIMRNSDVISLFERTCILGGKVKQQGRKDLVIAVTKDVGEGLRTARDSR